MLQGIRVNKEDWSGKEMVVHVDDLTHEEEQHFACLGTMFVAVLNRHRDVHDPSYDFDCYTVYDMSDKERKNPLVRSFKYSEGSVFDASPVGHYMEGYMRSHEHPFVAAAKVLANTY